MLSGDSSLGPATFPEDSCHPADDKDTVATSQSQRERETESVFLRCLRDVGCPHVLGRPAWAFLQILARLDTMLSELCRAEPALQTLRWDWLCSQVWSIRVRGGQTAAATRAVPDCSDPGAAGAGPAATSAACVSCGAGVLSLDLLQGGAGWFSAEGTQAHRRLAASLPGTFWAPMAAFLQLGTWDILDPSWEQHCALHLHTCSCALPRPCTLVPVLTLFQAEWAGSALVRFFQPPAVPLCVLHRGCMESARGWNVSCESPESL